MPPSLDRCFQRNLQALRSLGEAQQEGGKTCSSLAQSSAYRMVPALRLRFSRGCHGKAGCISRAAPNSRTSCCFGTIVCSFSASCVLFWQACCADGASTSARTVTYKESRSSVWKCRRRAPTFGCKHRLRNRATPRSTAHAIAAPARLPTTSKVPSRSEACPCPIASQPSLASPRESAKENPATARSTGRSSHIADSP